MIVEKVEYVDQSEKMKKLEKEIQREKDQIKKEFEKQKTQIMQKTEINQEEKKKLMDELIKREEAQ